MQIQVRYNLTTSKTVFQHKMANFNNAKPAVDFAPTWQAQTLAERLPRQVANNKTKLWKVGLVQARPPRDAGKHPNAVGQELKVCMSLLFSHFLVASDLKFNFVCLMSLIRRMISLQGLEPRHAEPCHGLIQQQMVSSISMCSHGLYGQNTGRICGGWKESCPRRRVC